MNALCFTLGCHTKYAVGLFRTFNVSPLDRSPDAVDLQTTSSSSSSSYSYQSIHPGKQCNVVSNNSWVGSLNTNQAGKASACPGQFLNPPSVLFDLLCFLFVHFESKSRLLQEGLPCLSFLSFSTRCQAGLNLRR
ncbi:conserved hypothetical protein [Trichinella spiralis]|uniref:hypothetical protein n=1 Tax=Trichinella spiralis TaxID=6334 RepID=UPI0001EFB353|nr:conserved hypothetical protein [Trichinella spiralis]